MEMNTVCLCRKALPRKFSGKCRLDLFFCGSAQRQILPKANWPKGCFQMKKLDRTTKAIAQMNADCKVEKAQYAEFNAPTCDKIAVWQLCKERHAFVERSWFMIAWNWNVWINAIVFVPTAKAPPKAGAKELSYNSLNSAYSGQHPCFGPNWIYSVLPHMEMNTVCLEKLFPRK